MVNYNSIEYFENFDKIIRISDYDSLLLKRLPDTVVMVSYFDVITGTTTKLAFYKEGRWVGYNPTNYSKLFSLFRTHKNLKPGLIRFLTPENHIAEFKKIERVFICFKKKFHITIRKTKKNLHIE